MSSLQSRVDEVSLIAVHCLFIPEGCCGLASGLQYLCHSLSNPAPLPHPHQWTSKSLLRL